VTAGGSTRLPHRPPITTGCLHQQHPAVGASRNVLPSHERPTSLGNARAFPAAPASRYDGNHMSARRLLHGVALAAVLLVTPHSGVGAAPPPTTHEFTVTAGGRARVFFLASERKIPIRLRNDGFITWRPGEGFTFSHLWISPGGNLVAEGFRTRLPTPVAPGESISLHARVKNFPDPGIYRLRWDLVQEGVTWFSEKDRTPEPARWVVVLPTVKFFLVFLLPSAAALAGVTLHRLTRRRAGSRLAAVAAGSDLAWAAVSLFGKPFLLYAELPRRFIPEMTWANSSAVAVPLLLLLALPRRLRAWAAWLVVAMAALLVWGQTLYLRFFGDVATSAAVLASRQTGEIVESIGFLGAATDWWLVVDLVLVLPLIFARRKKIVDRPKRLAPVLVLILLALPLLAAFRDLGDFTRGRNLRTLQDVRDFGLYGYQILDVAGLAGKSLLRHPPDEAEMADIVALFRESRASRAPVGPTAGRAAGYNLIAIQVESMQQFALDFEVDGQPVMPNLQRLAMSALTFTTVQDQTSRGRSSAGDFVVNTSLLPVAESVAYEYPDNAHRGYAHAMRENGYTTLSAIPYKRHFWNRFRTHPAYGFETNLFVEDFERATRVGWGLNDRDFLLQMAPRLATLKQPFCAWLTTLSVHHPYGDFPTELKSLDMGDLEGSALGNYLHGMSLLDRALRDFFTHLDRSGLLDRTVIALWGDHSSGLLRDERWVDYFDLADSGPRRFLFRGVPFLLWVPGEPELRGRIETPAGQVDIAPTLLALLGGHPEDEPFLGRNLLGDPGDTPVVHPQGSWLSESLLYLNPREDVDSVRCRDSRSLAARPLAECRPSNRVAKQQIEVSEVVLEYDLQMVVRSQLRAGLPPRRDE